MPSLDQIEAFVTAAEKGSFSSAARHLKKAQSAISSAVINLEIECGVLLFDRSQRNPVLTEAGQALLNNAYAMQRGTREFIAKANSLAQGIEKRLSLAIEESIPCPPVMRLLQEFEQRFPYVELELLNPSTNDVAKLLREGRAHLGMMYAQEEYPQGFSFKGVCDMPSLPVCGLDSALASMTGIDHQTLSEYRQLVVTGREQSTHKGREIYSNRFWKVESNYVAADLLKEGIGWAWLPEIVVNHPFYSAFLVKLDVNFLKADVKHCVDVVWTQQKNLGPAGCWLQQRLFDLKIIV